MLHYGPSSPTERQHASHVGRRLPSQPAGQVGPPASCGGFVQETRKSVFENLFL